MEIISSKPVFGDPFSYGDSYEKSIRNWTTTPIIAEDIPTTTIKSKVKHKKENATSVSSDSFKVLAEAIRPHLDIPEEILSEENVQDLIEKRLAGMPIETMVKKFIEKTSCIKEIHIKDKVGDIKNIGRQHYMFPLIMKLAEQRIHTYLVGPAGSGKTQTVENAAEALKLKFFSVSVCSQSTEYLLKGYYDANGKYVKSLFRECYENGGIFLIDEIDAGNPNIIACLNGALSNHVCAFPDGMVKKHDDFICFAAANTWGTGSSREYVGRNPLDAATLDRFAFVEFLYDHGLEYHMVGLDSEPSPKFNLEEGGTMEAGKWANCVQTARKLSQEIGLKTVISPRASKTGAILLKAGVGKKHIAQMLIFKGMDKIAAGKISSKLWA